MFVASSFFHTLNVVLTHSDYRYIHYACTFSPPLTFVLVISPPLLGRLVQDNMADTWQVATSSQERTQVVPHTRSRRYKATNMAFEEMVAILRREDYDAKHGPYKYPNKVKAQIMDKVVKTLYHKFGVAQIQGTAPQKMVWHQIEGAGAIPEN